MKKASKAILAAFGLTEVLVMSAIVANAKVKNDMDCDYLLVLGCEVNGADTPSRQMTERVNRAYEYLTAHENAIAVPCGGCFRKEQKKSEAEIMASMLINMGIDESRIILEDKSTTTYENFSFAREIIKNHSTKNISEIKIGILSSDYHLLRSRLIAGANGINAAVTVGSKTHSKVIKSFIRELVVMHLLPYSIINDKVKK